MVSAAFFYTLLLSTTTALAAPRPIIDSAAPVAAKPFVLRATEIDGFAPAAAARQNNKRKRANRCTARSASSSSLSSTSSTSAAPTTAPAGVGAAPPTTTQHPPTKTSSSSEEPATTTTSKSSGGGGGGGNGGGGGSGGIKGAPVKPANWPTETQAGPNYKATVASPSDPYLKSVSQALNNKGVPAYNAVHSGDLTYYQTGQVACGDYYTDDTWTAAVSHQLWDAWPGSGGVDTPRSPLCGPFVPGREILNNAGGYSPAIASSLGKVIIGGDGKANCQSGVGLEGQCHIPLTATITNHANGKKAVVKIVDKCGGCAGEGDIDVTPTVFAYLSDMSLGRVPVSWEFNHF